MVLSNSMRWHACVVAILFGAIASCYGEKPEPCRNGTDAKTIWLTTVYPHVREICVPCHKDNPAFQLDENDPEGCYKSYSAKSREMIDGISKVLAKPSGHVPHKGGTPCPEGSVCFQATTDWVAVRDELPEDIKVCAKNEAVQIEALLARVRHANPKALIYRIYRDILGRDPDEEVIAQFESGEFTLEEIVIGLLGELESKEWFTEQMNYIFHTDFYRDNGAEVLNSEDYPEKDFYMDPNYDEAEQEFWKKCANEAVGREPLNTAWEIFSRNRDFRETLMVDVAVNPCSARVYGISLSEFKDPWDPEEYIFLNPFHKPHGGGILMPDVIYILITSTPMNLGRARARLILIILTGEEILKRGTRPLSSDDTIAFYATRDVAECTKCHDTLDRLATVTILNWDDDGRWQEIDETPGHMLSPGIEDLLLPYSERHRAIPWLGETVYNDPALSRQFLRGIVTHFFIQITRQEILEWPSDPSDPYFAEKVRAAKHMDAFIDAAVDEAITHDGNLKYALAKIFMSEYYSGVSVDSELTEGEVIELGAFGNPCQLTPEMLDQRLQSMGLYWEDENGSYLTGKYFPQLGGADSKTVLYPFCEQSGFGALVIERMATEVSCELVPNEFSRPAEEREWLKFVEIEHVPSLAGIKLQEIVDLFGIQVQFIYERMHGVPMQEDELQLYLEYMVGVYEDAHARIMAEEVGADGWTPMLPKKCQATGEAATFQITEDPNGTITMWWSLFAALLSDTTMTHSFMPE